jgi:RNA polymerase-binding transcription factor DksA
MSHISETQLKQYKSALLQSLDRVRYEITDILMHSSDACYKLIAKQLQIIPADELLDLVIKFNDPNISSQISELKRIDAALNNIEIGMYGLCADCEAQLTIEQLDLDPARQRCSNCHIKYHKQKYNEYKL